MTDRPSPTAGLLSVGIGFAAVTIISFLSTFFLASSGISMQNAQWLYGISLLAQAGFVIPPIFYYCRKPRLIPALRVRSFDPISALMIALAAIVATFTLNWLTSYWVLLLNSLGFTYTGTSNLSILPSTPAELALSLIAVSIAPAVMEEILFRGLLMPSFESLGKRWAVFLSGTIFALVHATPEALPAHLILGFILGAMVLRTGSLLSSMLFHGVYNASIMVVSYLALTASSGASGESSIFTLEAAVSILPIVVLGFALLVILLELAYRRSDKKGREKLPDAERKPLSLAARWVLAAAALLLIAIQISAWIGMLPPYGL